MMRPCPCACAPQRSLLPLRQPTALLSPLPHITTSRARSTSSSSSSSSSSRTRASVDDKSSNPFLSSPSSNSSQPQAPAAATSPTPQPTATTSSPTTSTSPRTARSDARVESLEAAIRAGKRNQRRIIPIRGVDPPAQAISEEFAPWKEGQLWPEGWESMTSAQKTREMYMGQRGVLFWINKLAYGAAIAMLGGWVFFRLIGPNLGLYQLAGDMMPNSL